MKLNFWATPNMKALFQIFPLIYYVFSFGPWAEYESSINAASLFFAIVTQDSAHELKMIHKTALMSSR